MKRAIALITEEWHTLGDQSIRNLPDILSHHRQFRLSREFAPVLVNLWRNGYMPLAFRSKPIEKKVLRHWVHGFSEPGIVDLAGAPPVPGQQVPVERKTRVLRRDLFSQGYSVLRLKEDGW